MMAHDCDVLDELTRAHRELDRSDKSSRKKLKKDIDQRRKSLETLGERISDYESQLGQGLSRGSTSDDYGLFGHSAQAEAAPTPGVDGAPSESTATPASDSLPAEGQTQDMEVDDEDGQAPSASVVSPTEDDLLTGDGTVDLEGGLVSLTVSLLPHPEGGDVNAST